MSKIEIFVSDKCPDCALLIRDRIENPDKYKGLIFYNITESMANLKRFLYYRDRLEGFEDVREACRIGVPSKVIDERDVEFL
ncbi:hypothetical protein [Anaerococcus tetradius]|uniref:hypothetical protein n=1 Tax=Anaerococcus tetradius TaxID=33036 RepID=UPI0023F22C3C|nr:hypothetical protein [Anaerococcus tetradius]